MLWCVMSGLERFIGEVLDGKYRLERLLGQGGMGAVYLATHLGTERPVAVKVIAPQFMKNDEFVERFKREARAAGRLRHPNVRDVTDFGFAHAGSGARGVSGDGISGRLHARRSAGRRVDACRSTGRSIYWSRSASAVHEAHEQGIVHRDLKPDNIWLEPNRAAATRVKVLDFGIAKLADPNAATGTTGEFVRCRYFHRKRPDRDGRNSTHISKRGDAAAVAQQSQQSQLDLVQASIARAASSVGRTNSGGGASHGSSSREGASEAATQQLQLSNAGDAEEQQTRIFAPPSTSQGARATTATTRRAQGKRRA